MITPALLVAAIGCTQERAELYAPHLAEACAAYHINTPARLAAFLAQIGHESGSLRHVREVWGPTPAQERYEGRSDLGNTQPGDGRRYAGHGLIQITGRFNHRAVRDRMRISGVDCPDFEAAPELLAEPKWAAWSAADFWGWKNCNALADAGSFEALTVRINGGTNGMADRMARWERAQHALGTQAPPAQEKPATTPQTPSGDPTSQSQEGGGMPIPALAAALLPSVISAIPELAKLFKSGSAVSERNVQAATTILDIVTKAVPGAANAQAAVEAIQADPVAREAAKVAVERDWFKLHQAAEDSVASARAYAVQYAENTKVRTVFGRLTFLEALSLLLVMSTLGGGISVLLWGGVDDQLKGAIVTLMLIGGFTGVVQFWFGSSLGSKKKDDEAKVI